MPEPSPNPPMLPPFRRPHAPPPPPPSTSPPTDATRSPTSPSPVDRSSIPEPPRASLGNLPRRSMLAPEVTTPSEDFARGRDSDEHKGEEPEGEKHRKHRPRKKRRSRILSELRPVDGPQSALQPSVPDITDDDSQDGDNPLEAPDSGARAKEAFAAQRVRMRKAWCPDLRIYMYVRWLMVEFVTVLIDGL
ncbi:hypothetical protein PHYBOEH_000478 [Phytophthora boehmeriae]|uniref:Uncharacterized protein n=1 Tax=Phytophthora boehmeriae TaxID=109152 RepID=A0A8T1WTZ5_9STRA|nr:hypothetical protein PHYBOEH_000478 [Phytophthora boehmeriae]